MLINDVHRGFILALFITTLLITLIVVVILTINVSSKDDAPE